MRGTNRCISNIGLIGNSSHVDARIGIRKGTGLDETLRNIQRWHGNFRRVLLPFLCQRDVMENSYLSHGRERILLFRDRLTQFSPSTFVFALLHVFCVSDVDIHHVSVCTPSEQARARARDPLDAPLVL